MNCGWPVVRLGDHCTKVGSGATPRGGASVYQPHGVAFIRSQNVYNARFEREGLAFIADHQAAELDGVRVEKGDVLLNITGDSVARVSRAPADVLPARVSQHVAIIRPDENVLSSRFLFYFLVNPRMQAHMLALASAGGTRKALTKGMIEDFRVPAPSLPEQRMIASTLAALDDKIELNREMNRTLEAMAQALFRSWFVDFDPVVAKAAGRAPVAMDTETANLFPDRFVQSDLGLVPEGWETRPVGDVMDIHDSRRIPLSGSERSRRAGAFPYYGAAGVLDHVDDFIFDHIALLVGEDGSVITEYGYPVTQYVWGRYWVNNHAHVLTGKAPVSTETLLVFFRSVLIGPYVTGAVQPKLNQKNLKSIPFLDPKPPILKAFDDVIQPLFAMSRALHDMISTLRELRDSLLPRLLDGRVSVQDIAPTIAQAM